MRLRVILLLVLCLAPGVSPAQQTDRVFRIGYLWIGRPDGSPAPVIESFRVGMREQGYVEGRNLVIEMRDGRGQADRLTQAAAELVPSQVDAILTSGTASTIAAKEATADIPIIFGSTADPVGRGLVASLAHPGGNITGFARELGMDKAFGFVKEVMPGAHRVGLVYHSANMPAAYLPHFMAERADAAQALGLTLVPQPVPDAGDLDAAFAIMAASHVEAVLIVNDAFLAVRRSGLLVSAVNRGVPTICLDRPWAEAGCLISYGEGGSDIYRHLAVTVDKILKGARPGDLPVEQATTFELMINLATARALGLTIPANLLALADEVIE